VADAPTRISANQRVDGTLRASEDVSLAGRLYGRLESDRTFTVEEGAYVEAECFVKTLVVHGIVVGDIHASEDLIIERTGQVQGTIRARRMKLRAGGRISGQVATGVEVRLPTPRDTAATGAAATRRPPRPAVDDDWRAPAPARQTVPHRSNAADVDEFGAMPPRAPRPDVQRNTATESDPRSAAPGRREHTPDEVELAPPHAVESDHPGEVVESDDAREPLRN
jgi:cytoskeletal protein CcmA (bactofilin family)